jgi:prevent-host-death family protein
MKVVSVRELKSQACKLLRQAANEDVIITSRGRPVARLIGLLAGDMAIRPQVRRQNYADHRYKREVFRLLAGIWKIKPDKDKKWVSQEHHDLVLYRP